MFSYDGSGAESWMKRSEWMDLGAKLLVPLALGLLALVEHRGAQRIANAQLDLSRQGEQRQRDQVRVDTDLKYMELFYQDIRSGDPVKQRGALALLELMNSELGQTLAAWAERNAKTEELKTQARETGESIASLAPLNPTFRTSRPRFLPPPAAWR